MSHLPSGAQVRMDEFGPGTAAEIARRRLMPLLRGPVPAAPELDGDRLVERPHG
jgi:hypothetical protein